MIYSIIGDIVNSKDINDRFLTQEKLKTVLTKMNIKYKDILLSELSITLGDEFQALFNSPKGVFHIIQEIRAYMYPVLLRFGIGYGNLLTDINNIKNSMGTDGPTWWKAREALDITKSNSKKNKLFKESYIHFKIKGDKDYISDLINSSLTMMYLIEKDWTKNQREFVYKIINKYGLSDDFVQLDLAKQHNISPAAINKTLKATNYYYFVDLFNKIENFLINMEEIK